MADTERGSRGEDPDEPIYYSFLCPKERIGEVRELVKKDQTFGSLSEDPQESVRAFLDPGTRKTTIIRGIEVTGVCLARNRGHILDMLATRGIAGYSRPTQILYPSLEDIEGEQRFREGINRHNQELNRKGTN